MSSLVLESRKTRVTESSCESEAGWLKWFHPLLINQAKVERSRTNECFSGVTQKLNDPETPRSQHPLSDADNQMDEGLWGPPDRISTGREWARFREDPQGDGAGAYTGETSVHADVSPTFRWLPDWVSGRNPIFPFL